MKIGKNLRDLLLSREQTYAISSTKCDFMGEIYTYTAVTDEERQEIINHLIELIK